MDFNPLRKQFFWEELYLSASRAYERFETVYERGNFRLIFILWPKVVESLKEASFLAYLGTSFWPRHIDPEKIEGKMTSEWFE